MAQEESAAPFVPAAERRSMSDRPFVVRAGINVSRFIRGKPLGAFGALMILVVVFMAVFADVVQRYDPEEYARGGQTPTCAPEQVEDSSIVCFSPELFEQSGTDPTVRLRYHPSRFEDPTAGEAPILILADPSADHWLGTDKVGRDIWSRTVHGARLALLYGIGGALIAVSFGVLFGVMSAYFGGTVDMIIMRIADAFQAFPALILLLIFAQVFENPNVYTTTGVLGFIGIAASVRISRSAVLATRQEVYVLAAETIGASNHRIMGRHILPNIMAPIIVIFTTSIGLYILAEAGLSFLGLGDPLAISWGKMINEGRTLGPADPGMALYVGGVLTLTVMGFNLLGDALRDVLDPRLRGRGGRAGF